MVQVELRDSVHLLQELREGQTPSVFGNKSRLADGIAPVSDQADAVLI